MKRVVIIVAMFCVVAPLAVAPLAAVPEPSADEVQANRRRLEQLRKHQPEALEKLRAEAKEFFALPKERRQRIVEMHRELHKQGPAARARLYRVLDRYVDWLEDLDKLDKAAWKKVAETTDKQKRLELLRQLREQEWTRDQPKATRDQLAQLEGDARTALIAKEKAGERRRRFDWLVARTFWAELEAEVKGRRTLPTRSTELPTSVQNYVRDYLMKMFLSQDEKDELAKFEGQWPQYPMKLVELADRHPPALPGPLGPKRFAELPARVYSSKEFLGMGAAKLLKKEPLSAWVGRTLRIKEGAWPDFGVELARFASQRGHMFEHEFLAYKLDCLSPPMQDFVKKQLKPALDGKESLRLVEAYGKWPDYPQTIHDLARDHHLRPPWFTLPAPKGENWENYRLPRLTGLSP
ncbi:MAG: hypothetical protein L0Y71_01350 [Gemmataceae bacterium]|nr:hypothetical protein [Gemmataceae bacterium]